MGQFSQRMHTAEAYLAWNVLLNTKVVNSIQMGSKRGLKRKIQILEQLTRAMRSQSWNYFEEVVQVVRHI